MKISNRLIFTSLLSITGTYLFYQESIGINCLIFTIISCIIVVTMQPQKQLSKRFIRLFPSLLCATMLCIYPQKITYLIWLLSFLIMWSALFLNYQPLLLPLQSIISIFESPLHQIKLYKINEKLKGAKRGNKSNIIIYSVSGIIILLFTSLYANSNPIFSTILTKIDLSFIDLGFIFTLLCFFGFLFGLLHLKLNDRLAALNLRPILLNPTEIGDKEQHEFKIAQISLWAIATLLGIVNLLDIAAIFTGKLPEGLTYSQYVHQGFYTLIFSISIAIGLVIYLFRNSLNFHKQIQQLRKASYFWIAQNIALALLTTYKNMLYMEVYGLTYKRIAVVLCLICTLIGLIISIRKIKFPSTNWSYYNRVALYAFTCAVLIALIPFDKIITNYNINYSQTNDVQYLIGLKNADLLAIEAYLNEAGNKDETIAYETAVKLVERSNYANNISWQSWNYQTFLHKKSN